MSDAESDCDDVFTDDSKGYANNEDSKSSPGPDEDGRNLVNRKKRRGIIEKRRRDRINNSLSELRRLVPAAFEKQGSAKLEKAEILQMTVDHLRILHSKGPLEIREDGVLSADYQGLGFRECAGEVSRYLVGFEGLDAQDPLRLRLMSHLHCFSSQRDAAFSSARRVHQPQPWFAVPAPHYPHLAHFSRSSSSSSSRMSVDGAGRKSEARSPPYRPWGGASEVAY